MGMGQNLVPLVNPKIAGKWMFIPLKMVLIGIDPYPHASAIVFLAHIPMIVNGTYPIIITYDNHILTHQPGDFHGSTSLWKILTPTRIGGVGERARRNAASGSCGTVQQPVNCKEPGWFIVD